MSWTSNSLITVGRSAEPPQPGDYLTDGRELYCIEELFGDHALIEDCRRGDLIDIGMHDLHRLEPVKRSSPPIESRA